MNKTLSTAIYALVVLGLAANAYFMLDNGEPDKLWWWPLALVFFAWAGAPFSAIAMINWFLAKNVASKIALLVTAVVVTGGGVFILIQAFIVHLDAQSGIIFVFLPVYQFVIVAIGVILIVVTGRPGRVRSEAPSERLAEDGKRDRAQP